MTHDYKRHGTTTLFAALDVKSGLVIGECLPRHPLPGSGLLANHEYPYWSSRLFIPFSTVAQQCICHDNELAHDCCDGQFFALPS